MFVFYDWPFPHMYFAKNVASIIFPYSANHVWPLHWHLTHRGEQ